MTRQSACRVIAALALLGVLAAPLAAQDDGGGQAEGDEGAAFSVAIDPAVQAALDAAAGFALSAAPAEDFDPGAATANLVASLSADWTLSAGEVRLFVGAGATVLSGTAALAALAAPGVLYPGALVLGAGSSALVLALDELWLRVGTNPRLSVGRMILNLGRGSFFSPADVFSPPTPTLAGVARPSADVALLAWYPGDLLALELYATPGADLASGGAAARLQAGFEGLDLAALASWKDGVAVFALDFKADVLVGLYGEAVATLESDEWRFETLLGADFSAGDLVALVEWRWSSRAFAPGDPAALALGARFPAASYVAVALSLPVDDSLSLSFTGIWDPENGIDAESLGAKLWLGGSLDLVVSLATSGASFATGAGPRSFSFSAWLRASF